MTVHEWVHALADRLGITEELRRAFILEVLTLPNSELRVLTKVNPQKPERLSTAQADIVVECLERAAERVSREQGRPLN